MATLGVSYLSFSWPYEQAKCLDTQFYPMERDRLGQGRAPACCCFELAPSVSEEVFQQSSEDLLAQLSCAAGQFPSTARALVSQLEQQLTLLMLHQRRPGSLSFYQVVFSKNAQLEGWGARCWDAGCSSPRWRQGWWQGWWQGWVRLCGGTSAAHRGSGWALSVLSIRGCPGARLGAPACVCLAPAGMLSTQQLQPGAKGWPPALRREARGRRGSRPSLQ